MSDINYSSLIKVIYEETLFTVSHTLLNNKMHLAVKELASQSQVSANLASNDGEIVFSLKTHQMLSFHTTAN